MKLEEIRKMIEEATPEPALIWETGYPDSPLGRFSEEKEHERLSLVPSHIVLKLLAVAEIANKLHSGDIELDGCACLVCQLADALAALDAKP